MVLTSGTQISAASIRLVYFKSLYIEGFEVRTQKKGIHFWNPQISMRLVCQILLLHSANFTLCRCLQKKTKNQATHKLRAMGIQRCVDFFVP